MAEDNIQGTVQTGNQDATAPVSPQVQAQPTPVSTGEMNTQDQAAPTTGMTDQTAAPAAPVADNAMQPTTPPAPQPQTETVDLGNGVEVTSVQEPATPANDIPKATESTAAPTIGVEISSTMPNQDKNSENTAESASELPQLGDSNTQATNPEPMNTDTSSQSAAMPTAPAPAGSSTTDSSAMGTEVDVKQVSGGVKEITPEPQGPQSAGIPTGMTVGQDAASNDPDPVTPEETSNTTITPAQPAPSTTDAGMSASTNTAPMAAPTTTQPEPSVLTPATPANDMVGATTENQSPTGAMGTAGTLPDLGSVDDSQKKTETLMPLDSEDDEEDKKKDSSIMTKLREFLGLGS